MDRSVRSKGHQRRGTRGGRGAGGFQANPQLHRRSYPETSADKPGRRHPSATMDDPVIHLEPTAPPRQDREFVVMERNSHAAPLLPGGREEGTPLARIGFHASHEQFAPSELLRHVKVAEAAGFDCAMSSDHFRPWGRPRDNPGSLGLGLVRPAGDRPPLRDYFDPRLPVPSVHSCSGSGNFVRDVSRLPVADLGQWPTPE